MARYRGPLCKLCRREGEKLFLKGSRCFTDKCAFERRKYAPGEHGQKRAKLSNYAIQLREKQKVKRSYGILETQFRKYYYEAEKKRGITGEQLILFLEMRLDNIIYRLGFAANRNQARQLINHGHFLVNSKTVSIPSYRLKAKDEITVSEYARKMESVESNISQAEHRELPQWLELEPSSFKGKVLHIPKREDIPLSAREQLIVELYSK